MEINNSNFYDFIIIGAGPAGLTASIVAARQGWSVVVLEKGENAGPKPRGEGMGYYPIVDEIIGEKFLPSIGLKSNGGRVWHSPGDLQTTRTFREYNHYFFEWRTFVDRFVDVAHSEGVQICLNCEVMEPIESDGFCVGVKFTNENGASNQIYGNSILDCSGHSGIIGKFYGIPYDEQVNCPIIKCLISEANLNIKDTPDLQFYLIGNGDLDYSPQFPQCVAYVFPLENRKAEVGLMLRMTQARNMKTVSIPDVNEILEVWQKIKDEYPGFSTFFRGAKIDYEEVTQIPNAKMVENIIPMPGVVLIGDSAGFVNPFGSSGLYYSMKMAKIWVLNISKAMKALKEEISNSKNLHISLWNEEKIKDYLKEFQDTPIFQEVKHYYNLIGAFEYKIFNRLRTSERINKKWDYIANLLEQA